MALNLKELIIVLALSYGVLRLARPIALRFTSPDDLRRRCRLWYVLSIAEFLCPEFWMYAALAIPLLIAAGRKDSNPAGLYLFLLHVIPPFVVPIRLAGAALFLIDNYILLSVCALLPAAIAVRRGRPAYRTVRFNVMDLCLLCYGALNAFVYVRLQYPNGELIPYTVTDCFRRLLVFLLTTCIPYFVISRSAVHRRQMIDTLAAFCLSNGILAAISIFESTRHWLLYNEVADRWGYGSAISGFLSRGEGLRAMASSGHPLALGYLLAIALGFWLYLQTLLTNRRQRYVVTALFSAGLLAAYSRGPWIGAIAICVIFVVTRPNALTNFAKAISATALSAVVVSLTPLGQRIGTVIPFFGGRVDYDNIVYRQRLWDRALHLIKAHPFLGDQMALLKMQDLRQGQGIIDLVNTYVQVTLDDGLLGLSLFLAFILIPLYKTWLRSRRLHTADPDAARLGAALASSIAGALFMLATGSFGSGPARMFYALAALGAAYQLLSARPDGTEHVRYHDPPRPLPPPDHSYTARRRLSEASSA
jgi:O-antigen ligase